MAQNEMPSAKCDCYKNYKCNFQHKNNVNPNQIFMENINDIAGTLAEVMIVCGIHMAKARATGQITLHAFLHYDEIRHRIDAVPHKHFRRDCVMFMLAEKCLMTRLEAQLAYSIMKRAFKAYYHGTDVGGLRNPMLEAQLLHTHECFWVHAAKRTAQIFAAFEGLFMFAQKHFERKIKCIYKDLYDRMKLRTVPIISNDSEFPDCRKDGIKRSPSQQSTLANNPEKSLQTNDDEIFNENRTQGTVHTSKMSLKLPHCYKCNCPKLVCECDILVDTGVFSCECSQGPFICRWVRDDEPEKLDPCILIPENHQCPVDCYKISFECDSDCECVCEEYECECECLSAESISIYDDYDYTDVMSRILEEVEEEQEAPPVKPPRIDMTPIHLRLPHRAYDCCRVAPPKPINIEENSSRSVGERELFSIEKMLGVKEKQRQRIAKTPKSKKAQTNSRQSVEKERTLTHISESIENNKSSHERESSLVEGSVKEEKQKSISRISQNRSSKYKDERMSDGIKELVNKLF